MIDAMPQHFKVTIPQDPSQTDMQKRADYIAAQLGILFHRDDITASPITDERHVDAVNDHIEAVGGTERSELMAQLSGHIETMDETWGRVKGAWGQLST